MGWDTNDSVREILPHTRLWDINNLVCKKFVLNTTLNYFVS